MYSADDLVMCLDFLNGDVLVGLLMDLMGFM